MIYRGVQQLHFVYWSPCISTILYVFTAQVIAICLWSFHGIFSDFKFDRISFSPRRIFLLHCALEPQTFPCLLCIIVHNDRHKSGRRFFQENIPQESYRKCVDYGQEPRKRGRPQAVWKLLLVCHHYCSYQANETY